MKPQLTGKALVAAGHLLAKQIGPNTPLKDISALISSLATHLDVALARGDLLQQQANQLAVENAKATEIIAQCKSYFIAGITNRVRPTNEGYLHMMCDTFKDESPATEAVIISVRAEGIHFAVNRMLAAWESGFINDTPEQAYDITGGFLSALEFLPNASPEEFTSDYHCKVRTAIAESHASTSDEKKLSALPVERDQYGYWTHPVYGQFCDGREHIAAEEFNQWLNQQDLQCSIEYRDEEVIDPAVDGYDISSWQPELPAGKGWFVASIHDTEDGAVCIWLRSAKDGE